MKENMIIHKLLDIFEYKSEYQQMTSKIPPQDMYVLERVYFNKNLTIKDIAKRYNIPPSTLTGIIDRLEKQNLIQRCHSTSDRRAIELISTPKGDTIVEKHIEEDELFATNFFGSLNTHKKENLKNLLEELLQNIDKNYLFLPKKES